MSTDDPSGRPPPAAASPEDIPGAAGGSGGDSDEQDLLDAPAGPPWTLEVLADLHAGRYPAAVAGPLREAVAADPWAASALTALDATVDQLSLLPTPRMPERFALRLDAAIAGEHRARSSASGVGAAAGTGAPGTVPDPGVPHPRQHGDQGVAARISGRQLGESPPRQRPPAVSGPPVLPFPQAGPPAAAPSAAGARPPMPAAPPSPEAAAPPPARRLGPGPAAPPGPPPAQHRTGSSVPAGSSASAGWSASPGSSAASFGPAAAAGPAASFAGSSGSLPVGPLGAPVGSLAAARARRRRWIGGLAAAAAVVAIGSATVASLQHSGSGQQAISSPPAPAPGGAGSALQLDPGRFGDALKQIEGRRPAGPLQNATTYASCLAANSIDPSAVSGVMSVTFQGRAAAAIAVVVDPHHSKVVVVGPDCGIDGAADQLAAQTVTG